MARTSDMKERVTVDDYTTDTFVQEDMYLLEARLELHAEFR
jgi:hypothetical protein